MAGTTAYCRPCDAPMVMYVDEPTTQEYWCPECKAVVIVNQCKHPSIMVDYCEHKHSSAEAIGEGGNRGE